MRREPTSVATFLKEDYLEPLSISQHTLARELGISDGLLEKILEEDIPLDIELDQRLSQRFHVHEGFFMSVQTKHQEWKKKYENNNL